MRKCNKCGQPFIKNSGIGCLLGYVKDKNLCNGCNATNSVIKRLSDGGEISMEDLKILPKYLVFDPAHDNPEEEALGVKFQKLIEKYEQKALTTG
nr:hypothetical protein [uncultured Butyrivibrio sp.]